MANPLAGWRKSGGVSVCGRPLHRSPGWLARIPPAPGAPPEPAGRARAHTRPKRVLFARAPSLGPPSTQAFLSPTRRSWAPPPSPRSYSGSAAQLTGGRQTQWLPALKRSCGGASLSRRHSPCAPLPHPGSGSGSDRDPLGASPRPLPRLQARSEAAVTSGGCAAMGAPVSP